MSSHIRCRTAAEIARDGDFITKGCGVDGVATFMLCQRAGAQSTYTLPSRLVQDLMQEISKPRAKAVVKRQRSHRRTHMKRPQKICGLRWRAKRIPTLRSKNRSLHIYLSKSALGPPGSGGGNSIFFIPLWGCVLLESPPQCSLR